MMEFQEGSQLLVLSCVLAFLLLSACWRHYCPLAEEQYDPEAEQRAAALLRELLSESERQQLAEEGYLQVPSPNTEGRVYRVPSEPGWVEVYQSDKLAMRVCVEPVRKLPAADVVLMHKLMIEGNEQEYLQKANVLRIRSAQAHRWRRGI